MLPNIKQYKKPFKNQKSKVFFVWIQDKVKPVFTSCPGPVKVTVHSQSEAVNVSASWEAPEATDNSGTVSITSSHQPGSLFPRGSTTRVTYRAEDSSGNRAGCAFEVSVTGMCMLPGKTGSTG